MGDSGVNNNTIPPAFERSMFLLFELATIEINTGKCFLQYIFSFLLLSYYTISGSEEGFLVAVYEEHKKVWIYQGRLQKFLIRNFYSIRYSMYCLWCHRYFLL